MNPYEPQKIEAKWQKKWLEERVYEPSLDSAKKPFYNLMMFPYPSAEGLHVGNMYAFTGADIYGRHKRMEGYDVFEPIGLDGFGIHSENYALKIGAHPMDQAQTSEKRFYAQLQSIGNGFAWDEHLETYDPEYYKWTQWIFAEMFKKGLAYRKRQEVNWCPKDQTVLADEQVENGKCERCGTEVVKKELEQWFFKITDYADRLLKNLDTLDWSEKVKIAQRNWIGKSEGAEIEFKIKDRTGEGVKVFTTRPDTLFGATFLVISPELGKQWIDAGYSLSEKAKAYITSSLKKKNDERLREGEKTGEAIGLFAINPVNQEEIPVWVADYVLGGYGTGAIMAVPAHDERDAAFAKKFGLAIREVIAQEVGVLHANEERRDGGCGVLFDPATQKYAVSKHPDGLMRLFGGGVDSKEDMEKGVLREATEESGLHDFGHSEKLRSCFSHYYNSRKNVHRSALSTCFLVILKSADQQAQKLEAHETGFELAWVTSEELVKNWNANNENHDLDHWFIFLREAVARAIALGYDTTNKANDFQSSIFSGAGVLIDSGTFSGMDSETAKWEITKFVHGERKIQFRLRDWLISRQRYWGPPIPMIYCEACAAAKKGERADMPGWYAVDEKDLPVTLPHIENFRPTGTGVSPLAAEKSFYEIKCPSCGAAARRETDVSDTFLDSAWYYLRYLDTENSTSALNEERIKKWLPAGLYTGGAEHAVLHLLYVRFVAMVLDDWGLLGFEEPFKKFRAHGLIIKDGAKMSKSKGNVINPDEYIANFGADTLRMYLMFLAPFEEGGDFRDQAILGVERFLKRVWNYAEASANSKETKGVSQALYNRTIKKVGEDIENLKFNTAISTLMIFLNNAPETLPTNQLEALLKLLAPFAPHLTEELWREMLGYASSIHKEPWPQYDPKLIVEETITLVLQVNSRTKDTVQVDATIDEAKAKELALQNEKVKAALAGAAPKKVVYVDKKLVNIVV